MFEGTYICDGCGAREPRVDTIGDDRPPGWARAEIRVDDVRRLNNGQFLIHRDLCEACQERLERVVDPRRWERQRSIVARQQEVLGSGASLAGGVSLREIAEAMRAEAGMPTRIARGEPSSLHEERRDPEDAEWLVATVSAPGWHGLHGKVLRGQRYKIATGLPVSGGTVYVTIDGDPRPALASWFLTQDEWKALQGDYVDGKRQEGFGNTIGTDDREHPRHRRAIDQLRQMREGPGGVVAVEQHPYGSFFPPADGEWWTLRENWPHRFDVLEPQPDGMIAVRHDGQPEEEEAPAEPVNGAIRKQRYSARDHRWHTTIEEEEDEGHDYWK